MSTPINNGNQLVYFQFGDPLTGAEFDGKEYSVTPTGIYNGALLTTVDNADVTVSPWTCVITDGTYTVTARAAIAYTVPGVSATNNVFVLRWYYALQNNWYVAILAVPSTNILPYDLVIGIANYSVGGVITGYNYATRTNPMALTNFLSVVPTSPASMRVVINGGWCTYGTTTLYVPTQLLPTTLLNASSNPRIDVVYINSSGIVSVNPGTEAVTPVANYPANTIALANLTITTTQSSTGITASSIQDARVFLATTTGYVDLVSNQSIAGTKTFTGGLVIPAVTSDPGSPVNGQMWLRTDF